MKYKINTKEELEVFVSQNWNAINAHINQVCENLPVPIYSSVDIREAKHKFSPVDHNIYPAGFNNICTLDLNACSRAFRRTLTQRYPEAKSIGIIPESHTHNTFYLDHLIHLGKCLSDAGYKVIHLSPDENLFPMGEQELHLTGHSKLNISILKARPQNGRFPCDIVLLNNDQSAPLPIDWSAIKTPVIPTPQIGWFKRLKTKHFIHYKQVADNFCQHFSIDPDLIQAKFTEEHNVNFSTKEGLERLGNKIDQLLTKLPKGSSIFVKGARGTYGMGISVVKSGAEIIQMNRKSRNKMDIGKNKIKFTSVLIQEGVETVVQHEGVPAEVSIYLVNGRAQGGFLRTNPKKNMFSNLNSRGTIFKVYCISEIRQNSKRQHKEAVYSVIARLATLASALEIKEVI